MQTEHSEMMGMHADSDAMDHNSENQHCNTTELSDLTSITNQHIEVCECDKQIGSNSQFVLRNSPIISPDFRNQLVFEFIPQNSETSKTARISTFLFPPPPDLVIEFAHLLI